MSKIKRLVISLFLCSMSLNAFAQGAQALITKTDGPVTQAQEQLIIGTFTYINKAWASQGKILSRNITEKYFEPNTTLIINGKKVYTGYDQFDTHFSQVGKNIQGKIRFPLLEVMSADDKLIVHFNEDIYDNRGTYYPTTTIAIFTLHNNRIQQWDEVVYTNYFCQPESEKVVYSK